MVGFYRKALFGLALMALFAPAGGVTPVEAAEGCIPDGRIDDTLGRTHCCSGQAVPGSTYCTNPEDYDTTWESCSHICGYAT